MMTFPVSLPNPWQIIIFGAAALALASCVQDTSPYHASNINRVVSEGNTVTITHADTEADGRPLAEGYCSKFDKVAHFERIVPYRVAHARFSSDGAVFICEAR